MNLFGIIGRTTIKFLQVVGRISIFTCKAISSCALPPYYFKIFLKQIVEIGYYSLPIVGLTTLFSDIVLALQRSEAG